MFTAAGLSSEWLARKSDDRFLPWENFPPLETVAAPPPTQNMARASLGALCINICSVRIAISTSTNLSKIQYVDKILKQQTKESNHSTLLIPSSLQWVYCTKSRHSLPWSFLRSIRFTRRTVLYRFGQVLAHPCNLGYHNLSPGPHTEWATFSGHSRVAELDRQFV